MCVKLPFEHDHLRDSGIYLNCFERQTQVLPQGEIKDKVGKRHKQCNNAVTVSHFKIWITKAVCSLFKYHISHNPECTLSLPTLYLSVELKGISDHKHTHLHVHKDWNFLLILFPYAYFSFTHCTLSSRHATPLPFPMSAIVSCYN